MLKRIKNIKKIGGTLPLKNKNFIYGLFVGFCVIPILDELTGLIVSLFELPKAAITKKILKENKIISELQMENEKVDDAVAIGFSYTPQEDNDDYFEDKMK